MTRMILTELLNLWERTEDWEEEEAIENLIRGIQNQKTSETPLIKQLNRELRRYDGFKDNQNDFDNLLSLLKICNHLEINIDQKINLDDIDTNDIINQMKYKTHLKEINKYEFENSQKTLNIIWLSLNKELIGKPPINFDDSLLTWEYIQNEYPFLYI